MILNPKLKFLCSQFLVESIFPEGTPQDVVNVWLTETLKREAESKELIIVKFHVNEPQITFEYEMRVHDPRTRWLAKCWAISRTQIADILNKINVIDHDTYTRRTKDNEPTS